MSTTPDTGSCGDNQCGIGRQVTIPLDPAPVRAEFPIFAGRPELVFFDNASTTQKPLSVIQSYTDFYSRFCANAGRAAYGLSTRAEGEIEKARKRVAFLINARSQDVVFTSGATESLNLVALSWGLHNLQDGDEVMVCLEDHKSTVLPWLNLKAILERFGIRIKVVPFTIHVEGNYELKSIAAQVTSRTKLLAMTHIHHLYGLDMEVKEVRRIVGPHVLISLDACQSIGHRKIDASNLNVDFLCFSGHKMFAGMGVGILWISPDIQGQVQPLKVGGKTPAQADTGSLVLAGPSLKDKLESGTMNIPAVLSLMPAIDLLEKYDIDAIEKRVSILSHYLRNKLKDIPGIDFAPGFGRCGCPAGYGIVSFRFEHHKSIDLAFLLDSKNIMVRTGDHCLGHHQPGDDYIRVSLHMYNTESEIDSFLAVLTENLA